MSKITPKNLEYDSTLPPFLARLQANNNSRDGRHEFHAARPKKARTAEDEAEDEPVYFDEGTGETLTKSEWEERDKEEEEGAGVEAKREAGEGKTDGGEAGKGKESTVKVAAIGGSKKRKAGKVVGVEEEHGKEGPTAKKEKADVKKAKPAMKVKKIKLSFGDDE